MSRFLISVLFFLWSGQSFAEDLRSELTQCRGIQSLAQRLQCYDRLVDRMPEISVTSTVASPAPQPPAPQPPVSQSVAPASSPAIATLPARPAAQPTQPAVQSEPVKPEELFGKSSTEIREAVSRKLEIENLDEISSKVTRIQISPSKEYVVYLENGQVWRQKDDAGKWRIKVGETAIISKAALGSFLMRSDARKKSVRAERLR